LVPLLQICETLQRLVDENTLPSGKLNGLGDKLQDAEEDCQETNDGFIVTPSDNQAGAQDIESLVGDLEDAINDFDLDVPTGKQLINQLLDISKNRAVFVIEVAKNTPGFVAVKIDIAEAALEDGDAFRDDPPTPFVDFKKAAEQYKLAIVNGEGAIP